MVDYFLYKAKEMDVDFKFAKKSRLNFLYQHLTILDIVFWFCQKKEKKSIETKEILEKLERQVKYYTGIFNREVEQWHSINQEYKIKQFDEKWENKITEYNEFHKCIIGIMENINQMLQLKHQQIEFSKKLKKESENYKTEMMLQNECRKNKTKRIVQTTKTGIFDISEFKSIPCKVLLDKPVHSDKRLALYYSPYREDGKSPSFRLYKETNSWYDFGRSEGGDVIALYQKIHDCDFKTALQGLKQYL